MKKLMKSKKVIRQTVEACNCSTWCMAISCGSACGSSPKDYQSQMTIVQTRANSSESYMH